MMTVIMIMINSQITIITYHYYLLNYLFMEECGIESLCMILNIIRHNFHMDNIIVCKVVVFFPLRNDIFIFDNLQATLEHLFPTVMSSIQNLFKGKKGK